jgi:hypothetical protein
MAEKYHEQNTVTLLEISKKMGFLRKVRFGAIFFIGMELIWTASS